MVKVFIFDSGNVVARPINRFVIAHLSRKLGVKYFVFRSAKQLRRELQPYLS